jgi:DNA-directed RNA polymerase specialized sigma24 family protein
VHIVTSPLTGQRSRSELIAELYERHAAGLFAYCHDQLGETASAGDAVVAVFTGVPTSEPPARSVLFALARREIYRRDVSYALPSVDSVADPATALIERVFRDIRPHQREVLLLSAVCGLRTPELSVVLDIAADTAHELTSCALRRFAQTLETATAAARSAPFAADVAEVYDAIAVAPTSDILARLPWHRPSAAVRARVLSALLLEEPRAADGSLKLPTKKLWPTTPTWPLPLSNPDQATDTVLVQTDSVSTTEPPRRRARHEATTEPMPKLRGSLPNAIGESRTRRRRAVRSAPAAPEVSPAPVDEAETFDAFRPAEPDDRVETSNVVTADAPSPSVEAETAGGTSAQAVPVETPEREAAKPGSRQKPRDKKVKPAKPKRSGERHYDWLWELMGFLICLAIALIVFFSLPGIVSP